VAVVIQTAATAIEAETLVAILVVIFVGCILVVALALVGIAVLALIVAVAMDEANNLALSRAVLLLTHSRPAPRFREIDQLRRAPDRQPGHSATHRRSQS
jgi:uncharacterized membrane protein YdfJ with MMPL/SSD domain